MTPNDSFTTGSNLVVFNYTRTAITHSSGRTTNSFALTPKQFEQLQALRSDDWTKAAQVFETARNTSPQESMSDLDF